MTNPEFEAIPDYEALPETASGRGPGVGQDLNKVKPAEILDRDIAIMGFMIQPNRFKETDKDADETTLFEFMDAAGDRFCFWHTSDVLQRQAEARWERQEVPWKTRLTMADGKSGRTYYTFA